MTDYVHIARTLAPLVAEDASQRDAERILPFAIFEKIASSGLGAARVQKELGGGDVSQSAVAEIFIALGKADPNVAQALFPHFINIEQLRLMAEPDAQARYLGRSVAVLSAPVPWLSGAGTSGGKSIPILRMSMAKQSCVGANFTAPAACLPT